MVGEGIKNLSSSRIASVDTMVPTLARVSRVGLSRSRRPQYEVADHPVGV